MPLLALLACALTLLLSGVLLGCGDDDEGPSDQVDANEIACAPGPPLGRKLELRADWEVGDRFPFTASFSKVDSSDQTENFEATTTGEFAVVAARERGHEIRWQMEDGLSVTFGFEPPAQFLEIFGADSELGGTYEVRFATDAAGEFVDLLNADVIRATADRLVDVAAERAGDADEAELESLRALLTSDAMIYSKFIEKPFVMMYPYGYTLDPRKRASLPGRFVDPYGGSLVRGVETREVTDPETDEGCVEITFEEVPDRDALRRAAARAGERLGTFEADAPSVASLRVKTTRTVSFDASAGLVRRIEQVRKATTSTRTIVSEETFVIDPASP